ncbi:MAG: pyruvate kinase [Lachnospiraceae bacterium]|nr:pyruvate kinase [Lachnospiraceae bacterium]MBR3359708.1 pyruvate kinase [Lachnospiraceae bacterium]
MRKTKIICTIGPASESEEVLTAMCQAGMDTARLNFSHGTHEEHLQKIQTLKKVRTKLGIPLPIMLDTKGPEYRLGTFENHKIELKDGDTFILTADQVEGNKERVSVSYDKLPQELTPGEQILINDGLVEVIVKEIEGNDIICTVKQGGVLSDRKSMNFPGKVMKHEYLSEQDKADILFGIENGVDFLAASFVSNKQNALDLRKFLNDHGGREISIIAKIENPDGVKNLDEICEVVGGVMVARGDLGVEIPFEEVPAVQKMMTSKCRKMGKRVVTATEMLESMIENPRPTRAEASDVANAVYEGTSAIMLSGETANGAHPVEAVATMAKIAEYTESKINYEKLFATTEYQINTNLDAISHAVCSMAVDVKAKAIVVNSITGITARMVSRFRCPADIIGTTTDTKTWRRLKLSWGVTPVLNDKYDSQERMFEEGIKDAIDILHLKAGDKIVLTGGDINGEPGNTDTIKVVTVTEAQTVIV